MANFSIINGGVSAQTENLTDIDTRYGPYESTDEAQEILEEDEFITPGLTVGIWNNAHTEVTEYWWQGGTTKTHLVPKQTSSNMVWG